MRKLKQEYVFELILIKRKKDGIDTIVYYDKILIDFLYLFYEEVQKANPTYKIWLIKDNASAHQKVAKINANIIQKKGIKKIDWLTNSPDLHFIEDIWDWEKEMLSPK